MRRHCGTSSPLAPQIPARRRRLGGASGEQKSFVPARQQPPSLPVLGKLLQLHIRIALQMQETLQNEDLQGNMLIAS
jgi:hypothetical protein